MKMSPAGTCISLLLKEGGAERRKIECAARRITSCESEESRWVTPVCMNHAGCFPAELLSFFISFLSRERKDDG